MSTAAKWLENLNKDPLVRFAQKSGVPINKSDNKKNIAAAIYNHLVANSSDFESNNDPEFVSFYRRLNNPGPSRTPAKKAAVVEVASPAPSALRSSRRQVSRLEVKKEDEEEEEEEESEDENASTEGSDAASSVHESGPSQTPKRPAGLELPPSPAVVTDAIDRQTAAWGKRINDTWTASGMKERSHALRALLSSVKAVETIVLILEGSNVIRELWPLRYLTTVPAVDAIHTPEFVVKLPDFFTLFDGSFWAPFSLWLLTSLFLPLVIAYFFNLSLQQSATATGTRRGGEPQTSNFDPLSFNIAKALIAYLVYGKHFSFWDVYSDLSIEKVNAAVPGQLNGMFTGTAVGAVGTLYEAILRK